MKDTIMFDESDIIVRTKKYDAYHAPKPSVAGQIMFVPKRERWQDLRDCFDAAYKWGYDWVEKGYCKSFHIVQNVGRDNNNVVYLVPRQDNDSIDMESVKEIFDF